MRSHLLILSRELELCSEKVPLASVWKLHEVGVVGRQGLTPVSSETPVGCVVAEATELERRGVQEDL